MFYTILGLTVGAVFTLLFFGALAVLRTRETIKLLLEQMSLLGMTNRSEHVHDIIARVRSIKETRCWSPQLYNAADQVLDAAYDRLGWFDKLGRLDQKLAVTHDNH